MVMTPDTPLPEAPRLLDGVRVLSFCHYLQGPAATQYLADMGADVIKIEPLGGAFERHWSGAETYVDGVSAFFLSANRNKRSLAIDLKHPEAAPVLRDLIASADILVENYRPGVLDRLGLGYDDVRAIRPEIVYASATGFGADGPMRNRPGQDLLIQARTGLIAATGGRPTPVGAAAADQHGAALLAMGILGGYVNRLRTGRGTRVETSLYNAGIDLQTEAMTLYFSGRHGMERFERQENLGTWFHEAPYGVYELADGWLALSLNPLERLIDALGDEDLRHLAGVNAYADRDKVAATLAASLRARHFADISPALDAAGVWNEKVLNYDEVMTDPQARHNGVFIQIPVGKSQATLVGHPLRYDGGMPAIRRLPPLIGEHSREVLAELGMNAERIELLCTQGVIGSP